MSRNKRESFFWTSYSDLMTSLFFVMLVLFVLVIVLLHNKISSQEVELEKYRMVDTTQYKFLVEAEQSIKNIDTTYFQYNEKYKRHTLKNISIKFRTGSSNISDISQTECNRLVKVGLSIKDFVQSAISKNPNVKYLLIIEGQSSKDGYTLNDILSYKRALALVNLWKSHNILFDGNSCEVIVSGSGTSSPFRVEPDVAGNQANQRFVIHVIPKAGAINNN
jgi:outer membrane protein OmpA-like peptidoglycan-associated protein